MVNEFRSKKSARRSKKCKKLSKNIRIVYSNIQGFTRKKNSLNEILQTLDGDICLLAETMTAKVKMEGTKCICPIKSVGQNVAIMLGKRVLGCPLLKIYEPNLAVTWR